MVESAEGPFRRDAAVALAGTWLAFCLAVGLALPQPPRPLSVALGALLGGALIAAGYAAAFRVRFLPRYPPALRAQLAARAAVAGMLLAAAALAVVVAAATVEPAVRARFAGRLGEPLWRPWALVFESSILEEVTFRLFAMSLIAWLAARLVRRDGAAMTVGLVGSAVLFGMAHLPAWFAVAHATPPLIAVVLLLNGLGGLLFGWLFWRWGLPYAILSHIAADVVVQTLGPRLIG